MIFNQRCKRNYTYESWPDVYPVDTHKRVLK